MKRLLLILGLCALGSPAFAATGWWSNPDCTGQEVKSLVNIKSAYFCIDSTSTLNAFSNVLRTEGVIIQFSRIGDRNQTAGGSCTVLPYETAGAAGAAVTSVTGLSAISGDINGDGIQDGASLNGQPNQIGLGYGRAGIKAVGITFQITSIALSGEQCVISVQGG